MKSLVIWLIIVIFSIICAILSGLIITSLVLLVVDADDLFLGPAVIVALGAFAVISFPAYIFIFMKFRLV